MKKIEGGRQPRILNMKEEQIWPWSSAKSPVSAPEHLQLM